MVAYRPGTTSFMVHTEFEIFPPESDLNDLFSVYTMNHRDVLYCIVGFPQKYLEKCIGIAEKFNCRLTPGRPVTITESGQEHFPFDHVADLTYTLENIRNIIPDDPVKHQAMLLKEQSEVRLFMKDRMNF